MRQPPLKIPNLLHITLDGVLDLMSGKSDLELEYSRYNDVPVNGYYQKVVRHSESREGEQDILVDRMYATLDCNIGGALEGDIVVCHEMGDDTTVDADSFKELYRMPLDQGSPQDLLKVLQKIQDQYRVIVDTSFQNQPR